MAELLHFEIEENGKERKFLTTCPYGKIGYDKIIMVGSSNCYHCRFNIEASIIEKRVSCLFKEHKMIQDEMKKNQEEHAKACREKLK